MERPPKNLNSTMRHCCGSSLASSCRASSRATISTLRLLNANPSRVTRSPPSRLAVLRLRAVLYQNLPHQPGANGQEMSAVLEFGRALFLQPQVSLVHQGSALQRMVGAFLPQILVRDPPEFRVNQRNHGMQGLVFAAVPVLQQLFDDFGLNPLGLNLLTEPVTTSPQSRLRSSRRPS